MLAVYSGGVGADADVLSFRRFFAVEKCETEKWQKEDRNRNRQYAEVAEANWEKQECFFAANQYIATADFQSREFDYNPGNWDFRVRGGVGPEYKIVSGVE